MSPNKAYDTWALPLILLCKSPKTINKSVNSGMNSLNKKPRNILILKIKQATLFRSIRYTRTTSKRKNKL